jgi:DNA-binding helix-hairpin-helix protein with protein kinase domain
MPTFFEFLPIRRQYLLERGQSTRDVDKMIHVTSHPYYDRAADNQRVIVQSVIDLLPHYRAEGDDRRDPGGVLSLLLEPYLAWRAVEKKRLRDGRAAARAQQKAVDKAAREARAQERRERQQALEAARERSRALRDRERAVRIAWREQRLAEKRAELGNAGELAPESAARWAEKQETEPKKPSPFDP